ncbi:MAG: DUF4276 family protein [Deltaproteobacteria bacterium]|nr:DUF4276 family protein [Deltaproteobacteria bacterium]
MEGASDAALLEPWLRRMFPAHTWVVHPHQGKGRLRENFRDAPDPRRQGLLDQLPAKLRAWQRTLRPDAERVVILVDADEEDCASLKRRIRAMWRACCPALPEAICIAVKEIEAFYLGEPAAIQRAFPGANLRLLRDHDEEEAGGTWELFQRVIGADYEAKVAWAAEMGSVLGLATRKSGSPSFRYFCSKVQAIAGETRAAR